MSKVNFKNWDSPEIQIILGGDTIPARVGPQLMASGWVPGVWVQAASQLDTDVFVIEKSDGNSALGFLTNGSENYGYRAVSTYYNYTSYQKIMPEMLAASGAATVSVVFGGPIALFNNIETRNLTGGGVRVGGAITWALNEPIYISENGLLCNDSEANLIAAGISSPINVGYVVASPSESTSWRLCAAIKY